MFRLLVLISVATMVSSAADDDLCYRFTGTMEDDHNRVALSAVIRQSAQGLSGSVAIGDDPKAVPIENAELHDLTLSFQVHDHADRIVTFRLKWNGGLAGEASAGGKVWKVILADPPSCDTEFIRPYDIGDEGVSAPVVVRRVVPEYTYEARKKKIEGTLSLLVTVDPNGMPVSIWIEQRIGFGLDQKAYEAVQQYKFKPGEYDGKPVWVRMPIEVTFRLSQ